MFKILPVIHLVSNIIQLRGDTAFVSLANISRFLFHVLIQSLTEFLFCIYPDWQHVYI